MWVADLIIVKVTPHNSASIIVQIVQEASEQELVYSSWGLIKYTLALNSMSHTGLETDNESRRLHLFNP